MAITIAVMFTARCTMTYRLAALLGLALCLWLVACGEEPSTEDKVCEAYKDAVRTQLRSPSTAEFPDCDEMGLIPESAWVIEFERIRKANYPKGDLAEWQRTAISNRIDSALLTQYTGNWEVFGHVDASNAYGTAVRSEHWAHVRRSTEEYDADGWDVEIWYSNP